MKPVQDILNRIRWDQEFGDADFMIGYYDRVDDRIIKVPFELLSFSKDDQLAFELLDSHGGIRHIPYHRVRQIYRNGCCIWSREDH